ncbi:hypothetical protein ARMGADRAFT_1065793 [Armillaria gallica]|uniref:Protein kinase domain-containing protein n=1 Tax=Armillaria gallica TaxID=47427 RepID=A0A2H3CXP8_ARMGA|nr:hypothetical protein ARMGADRAFT_1065793 [Armillaria gallica]
MRTHASDLSMSQYLTSSDLLRNPRNHSIPILDIIPIPDDEEKRVFMVMPRLVPLYEPDLHCRREFFEALRQLLEGLDFMHSLNISHGDVNALNFMIDYSKVCRRVIIRYYLIDFESAQEFPDGQESALAKRPLRCGVRSSLEFSLGLPSNPFKLDVYNAAATFFELCEQYQGLDDFRPLLLNMMSEDPLARPDMAEARRARVFE